MRSKKNLVFFAGTTRSARDKKAEEKAKAEDTEGVD
jgi:hypothetical protein